MCGVTGTPGTGSVSLSSALTGFQTPSGAGLANNDTFPYLITEGASSWEVGIGTYNTAGNSFARTTIIASSSGGAAISFTSAATVAITPLEYDVNYGAVPIGGVIMWSGSASAVPTGWVLCDGSTVARSDGAGNITAPDLRGKFIKGCGGSTGAPTTAPTVGSTGGAQTHSHALTIGTHAITQAELPNCTFSVTDPGHTHAQYSDDASQASGSGVNGYIYQSYLNQYGGNYHGNNIVGNTTGISVSSGGSDTPHGHTGSTSDSQNHEPPYYVLAMIMKH